MILCKTPRPLRADAYTVGGHANESPDSINFSKYYMTFRRFPKGSPFKEGDQRIVFGGLSPLIHEHLGDPVTYEEIDAAKAFCKARLVQTNGLYPFPFNEPLWRDVVDLYGGYPPISITAVPEGTVVYPGEPVIRCFSTEKGFGELAAHYEAVLMHSWSFSARLTMARHMLDRLVEDAMKNEPNLGLYEARQLASIMIHDFGYRSQSCEQEAQYLGLAHTLVFGGTDIFTGAYQAFLNGGKSPNGGLSVPALAHRNVQSFSDEPSCYENMYKSAPDGAILSMVADCYDFKRAVEKYILPLAKDAHEKKNGKVIVVRPDSGNALEQIEWIVRLAIQNGLYREVEGKPFPTTMKVIEGNGKSFPEILEMNTYLYSVGIPVHRWLVYGVGGYLRNSITRDMMSTKYALCEVGTGKQRRGVLKLSEEPGKATLPDCKVIRTGNLFENDGITLVSKKEFPEIEDIHIPYYYHAKNNRVDPVCMDYTERFDTIQNRVILGFTNANKTGGNLSETLRQERDEIANLYRST